MTDPILIPVSGMPPAGPLTGSELLYAVQGGLARRVTAQQIADLALATNGVFTDYLVYPPVLSAFAMVNQANAETFFPEGIAAIRSMFRHNATRHSEIRVTVSVGAGSASPNSPRVWPKYSIDNGATWINIGSTALPQAASLAVGNVMAISDWIALPVGARADALFRCATAGGDGVADPSIWRASVQFR